MPKLYASFLLAASLLAGSPLTMAATGQELFQQNCMSCHGDQGVGIPGIAPPLVNAALWPRLGDAAVDYLTGVVAKGMTGRLEVNGQLYIGLVMPPQVHITPEEVTEIASYVLRELNQLDVAVTADRVAAAQAHNRGQSQLRQLRQGE